jgi:hypothetical protein
MRRFFNTDKTAWFPIACGVTGITFFQVLIVQAFLQPFNALVGIAFFGIVGETEIFLLMAGLAGEGTRINGIYRNFCGRAWRHGHHGEHTINDQQE